MNNIYRCMHAYLPQIIKKNIYTKHGRRTYIIFCHTSTDGMAFIKLTSIFCFRVKTKREKVRIFI